jgi:4-alpha-glucanotransferase
VTDPLVRRYEDGLGVFHDLAPATEGAVQQALGEVAPPTTLVATAGHVLHVGGTWEVTLEDGATLRGAGALPPDLPIGYHDLVRRGDSTPMLLLVRPPKCPQTAEVAQWGVAVQLYAALSQRSWGVGDFADLSLLGRWARDELQADFVLINPLYAASPGLPQEPSPYSPTTRLFLNPLYLAVEQVDGFSALPNTDALLQAGRQISGGRLIDRDASYQLKLSALDRLWQGAQADRRIEAFRLSAGRPLRRFATYCAVAEKHGPNWHAWPAGLRHPDAPALARFAAENAERVHFHEWVQWLLDRQLGAASAEVPLMMDLPIGFDPDGADAWAYQDALALSVRVGAPPDEFNPRGQDWGLPPFAPHHLARVRFRPFVETLRMTLRRAWALRIDHVMGLFRQFWVPLGMAPSDGAYVLFPHEELLAILAIESHRAGAVVVGEDLGTVEPQVRQRLADLGLLSYKLLWFEPGAPDTFNPLSMAAVTTHDLPTVAGIWTGDEARSLEKANLPVRSSSLEAMRQRLRAIVGADTADVSEVIVATHRALGAASSRLVAATLEDMLSVGEPPNRPGTIREWPNWSVRLPLGLDEILAQPLPRRVAVAVREGRRHSDGR